MGVDTSTQPLTIYNMVSSLLTIKIFLDWRHFVAHIKKIKTQEC